MISLRPFIALACWVALIAFLYWAVVLTPQTQQERLTAKLTILQQDVSSLNSRIDAMNTTGAERSFPERLLWKYETRPDLQLALQDEIVGLTQGTNVTLLTFGASPLERDTTQPMAAFEFEAEGPLSDFLTLLAKIENVSPKIAIASMNLRPGQNYGMTQVEDVFIYAQITIWAFLEGVPE